MQGFGAQGGALTDNSDNRGAGGPRPKLVTRKSLTGVAPAAQPPPLPTSRPGPRSPTPPTHAPEDTLPEEEAPGLGGSTAFFDISQRYERSSTLSARAESGGDLEGGELETVVNRRPGETTRPDDRTTPLPPAWSEPRSGVIPRSVVLAASSAREKAGHQDSGTAQPYPDRSQLPAPRAATAARAAPAAPSTLRPAFDRTAEPERPRPPPSEPRAPAVPPPVPPSDDPSGDWLLEGETLDDGRYVVEELIGEGVESRAYKARDEVTGHRCVIKQFLGEAAEQMEALLSSLESSGYEGGPVPGAIGGVGVLTIFDLFRVADRRPLLVMEYAPGGSLEGRIEKRRQPLPAESAAELYLALGSALTAAHEQGLLVGDLHPRQIMLAPGTGRPCKLDATAALLAHEPRELSGWLEVRGSDFLAPELAGAEPRPSPASDVWAFGASLARASTLRSPAEVARDPSLVPRPLRSLVQRCLDQQPERRPSVAEISRILAGVRDPSMAGRLGRIPRSVLLGGVAAIVLLCAGVGAWLYQGSTGGVVAMEAVPCPSREAMDRLEQAARSDFERLREYRSILDRSPGCIEVRARSATLASSSDVRALRSEHRRRLGKLPQRYEALDAEDRRRAEQSVDVLRVIGSDPDMVRHWSDRLRAGGDSAAKEESR